MEIKFKVDGTKIDQVMDWDSLEIVETQDRRRMKYVLAYFVVDESGSEVPYDKALAMIGKVKLRDVNPLINAFWKIWTDAFENPTTGDGLSEPSPKAEVPQSGGDNSVPQETGAVSLGS